MPQLRNFLGLSIWILLSNALLAQSQALAPVVINEIHYAPIDKTKPVEFVELYNGGNQPIQLGGWRLAEDIQYKFPPNTELKAGGFLVVAGKPDTFLQVFGNNASGPWSGRLKRGGGTVDLRDERGRLVDHVDYQPGFPWPTKAHGGGASIELIHPSLDNALGGSWRSSTAPSPGNTNSAWAANAPPQVRQVEHTPSAPVSATEVLITARVSDPDGVQHVRLSYQTVSPGSYIRLTDAAYRTNWVEVPMNDDGLGGDAIAKDGIYSATMPPNLQVHRELVRYRLNVSDTLNNSVTLPYEDDLQPNFAYFVYDGVPDWSGAFWPGQSGQAGQIKRFPASVLSSVATYHLLANQTDVINSQYNAGSDGRHMRGTFVYEGRVYDHITFHNRGEFSTYVSGKNKWRIHFLNTHSFRARDNYGRLYKEDWDDLNLNGGSAPWIAANRGMCAMEEAVSFRMYELLGTASPKTHYVTFRIIDNSVEAAPPGATVSDPLFPGNNRGQYSGDFWGVYMATESADGSFLDERDLADGNLYKIENGGDGTADKKNQGPTHPANTSDWSAFTSGSNRNQNESWWRTNLNLPAYYGFRLANRIVGNVDLREGWNHYFYHHPSGPWQPIPWDLDMMFVGMRHQSESGAIRQDRCMDIPALAQEKRNRAREILDLMLADRRPDGGQVGQLVHEYAQIVNPSGQELTLADADAAMWNFHPRTQGSPNAHENSNHKGNFFYSPHTFGAFGGAYRRWLRAPSFVGTAEFEDFIKYLLDYMTDTYRSAQPWAINNGNQLGYGYEFMKREARESAETDIPGRPTIVDLSEPPHPTDRLRFQCSNYQGAQFKSLQWRLGRISAPGLAGFEAGQPWKFEVEPHWISDEISTFTNQFQFPITASTPGHTYRARVRHKDSNGRWSRWSEAIQFVAGLPEISALQNGLVVTEIMYHPSPATSSELLLGFTEDDFEYLEIKNVGSASLDLTPIGFTEGVQVEFPAGTQLAAGQLGVIVRNRDAFQARYGTNWNILAEYGPDQKLSDSGERITLSFARNTPLRSLKYADTAPWPISADGAGPSLELIAPKSLSDPALPGNWQRSPSANGTPGTELGLTYSTWSSIFANNSPASMDLDGDGLINQVEYAFVGDPQRADRGSQPQARIEMHAANGTEQSYLTISYRGRTDSIDLGYRVEHSSDLTTWKPGFEMVRMDPQGDGTAVYYWRATSPISPGSQQFARVRVSL